MRPDSRHCDDAARPSRSRRFRYYRRRWHAVVAELVRRGETVRAVSRRGQAPQAAEGVTADAADPAQAAAAAAGATVIYHCASPPYTRWPELFPALTRSILGAAESSGAKLCSPTTCTPTGRPTDRCARTCPPRPAAARGGRGWRWPPRSSLRTARAGSGPRSGGPRTTTDRAAPAQPLARLCSGESWQARSRSGPAGSTSRTPSTTYPTSPAGCWFSPTAQAADGQIWHLPAAEPLTARQFFNLAAEAAGRPTPVKANTAGPALLRRRGRLLAAAAGDAGDHLPVPGAIRRRRHQVRNHIGASRADTAPDRRSGDHQLVPLPLTDSHHGHKGHVIAGFRG